mmetsp:Transcript_1729/g.6659  ORF Transcript_1729/g.6659 Transcript_1729/m.6659 type:complete len:229 (+) Transcript_1729:110-796(+)
MFSQRVIVKSLSDVSLVEVRREGGRSEDVAHVAPPKCTRWRVCLINATRCGRVKGRDQASLRGERGRGPTTTDATRTVVALSLLLAHEELLALRARVVGRCDRVADGALAREDLVVVAALVGLVAEEVNLVEVGVADEVEAEGLVPALGEDVERDLAADREGEIEVGELLLHGLDHGGSDVVFLVVLLEGVALFARAVAADGRDVEHALAELDEGAALDGERDLGHVG